MWKLFENLLVNTEINDQNTIKYASIVCNKSHFLKSLKIYNILNYDFENVHMTIYKTFVVTTKIN